MHLLLMFNDGHHDALCYSPIALVHSLWMQPERFASHPDNGSVGPGKDPCPLKLLNGMQGVRSSSLLGSTFQKPRPVLGFFVPNTHDHHRQL